MFVSTVRVGYGRNSALTPYPAPTQCGTARLGMEVVPLKVNVAQESNPEQKREGLVTRVTHGCLDTSGHGIVLARAREIAMGAHLWGGRGFSRKGMSDEP